MEVWLIKNIFSGDYYHFICVINCKFGIPKLIDMRRGLRPMSQNQKGRHSSGRRSLRWDTAKKPNELVMVNGKG